MIILFSGGQTAPELPDLHIQDSESLLHIPVGGVEGWDDDFLQAQTICFAPMDFQGEETGLTGGDETGLYWCRRLSKMLVRCSFSDSGATASIRPVYEDKDGALAIGDTVSISATSKQDGSNYMAAIVVLETYGANRMAIMVESVSAGTLNVSLAGV